MRNGRPASLKRVFSIRESSREDTPLSSVLRRIESMVTRLSEEDEERARALMMDIEMLTPGYRESARELEELLREVFIRPDPSLVVRQLVSEYQRAAPKGPPDWGNMR